MSRSPYGVMIASSLTRALTRPWFCSLNDEICGRSFISHALTWASCSSLMSYGVGLFGKTARLALLMFGRYQSNIVTLPLNLGRKRLLQLLASSALTYLVLYEIP